jgi:PKHD-type hydroxylase
MSVYQFVPSPVIGRQFTAYWENEFTQDDLKWVRDHGDMLNTTTAITGDSTPDSQDLTVRSSKVSWIGNNNDTSWLYDKLAFVARQLNGQFFGYDIWGFSDDFQYTVYDGDSKDHYDWHMDQFVTGQSPPRKLSLVMLLSRPHEYEGGDLEVWDGNTKPTRLAGDYGTIHAFPSWMLHRVTPVTAGTRRSLVAWTCGPAFR